MTNPKYAPERGEDWYYEQHVERGRSVADIAHDVDVGPGGVRRRLESYGILHTERPTYPELRDPEWLREQYVDNFRTCADIADELGCHLGTVSHWLEMYSIPRRSKSDYSSGRGADS